MAEANIPLLVTLYFSILVGLAGIVVVLVLRKSIKAALPSVWFFLLAAVVGLLPVCLFWEAESLLVQALYPGSAGVVEVAQRIGLLITLAPIAGVAGALILLVASLMPLPALLRAKRVFPALLILIIIELALIGMAVTVTMRTSWFLKVKETERL
jgi:predicted membrane channel-forming protein YqfA (hemolysin III family)